MPTTAMPRNVSDSRATLSSVNAPDDQLGSKQHHGHASDQDAHRLEPRLSRAGLESVVVILVSRPLEGW